MWDLTHTAENRTKSKVTIYTFREIFSLEDTMYNASRIHLFTDIPGGYM